MDIVKQNTVLSPQQKLKQKKNAGPENFRKELENHYIKVHDRDYAN